MYISFLMFAIYEGKAYGLVNHPFSYRCDPCNDPLSRLELLSKVTGGLQEVMWE
jgi:hypothetical protein